jgi:hypothetical protein
MERFPNDEQIINSFFENYGSFECQCSDVGNWDIYMKKEVFLELLKSLFLSDSKVSVFGYFVFDKNKDKCLPIILFSDFSNNSKQTIFVKSIGLSLLNETVTYHRLIELLSLFIKDEFKIY